MAVEAGHFKKAVRTGQEYSEERFSGKCIAQLLTVACGL
jgi:hypothetical protein